MRWWKLLGVAAFVGVAATGVLVARTERRHQDYTHDEIRERLHARAREAFGGEIPADLPAVAAAAPTAIAAGTGQVTAPPPAEPAALAEHAVRPSPAARVARARGRLAAGVGHARTRLGLRPRPTPRRRTAARP